MTAADGGRGPPTGRFIDVCNGDADGLCAVLQWRLHTPATATLVTGLKRDIELLERVQGQPGDEVLVCDISMQRNRDALLRLLAQGARVRYFDHHAVRDVPVHAQLQAHVDTDSHVCTSLLMDRHLGGEFRRWALVGVYGDNLTAVADELAASSGLAATDRRRLRRLGEAINYNAYGEDEADVLVAPKALYEIMARHRDPLDMLAQEAVATQLDRMRRADLRRAAAVVPVWQDERAVALVLPHAPWSGRVIGCLANHMARAQPDKAHAVLRPGRSGDLAASVRAPLNAPGGAAALCERFGGSGRESAAGLDSLPANDLGLFVQAFAATRWGPSR